LRGHPVWVVEHILLHELIHLRVPNHGKRFQALMRRSKHSERAEGYLEALESLNVLGKAPRETREIVGKINAAVRAPLREKNGQVLATASSEPETLPLFAPPLPPAEPPSRLNASTPRD
jgi:hypothetical protein